MALALLGILLLVRLSNRFLAQRIYLPPKKRTLGSQGGWRNRKILLPHCGILPRSATLRKLPIRCWALPAGVTLTLSEGCRPSQHRRFPRNLWGCRAMISSPCAFLHLDRRSEIKKKRLWEFAVPARPDVVTRQVAQSIIRIGTIFE